MAQTYEAPWAVTDFEARGGNSGNRIAVAAQHLQSWPSIVTVLDGDGRRHGTFAHAGWLERVHWVARDRLVVAGFSQIADGGMIALLDANALDGQSPAEPTSGFIASRAVPLAPSAT